MVILLPPPPAKALNEKELRQYLVLIQQQLQRFTDGVAVADATLATTGTADATYSANEVTMLNNLKTDVTTLKTQLNALLASLRTAGIITT